MKGKSVLLADEFQSEIDSEAFMKQLETKGYTKNRYEYKKEVIQTTNAKFFFPFLIIKPLAIAENILIKDYIYKGLKVDLTASFFNNRLENIYLETKVETWDQLLSTLDNEIIEVIKHNNDVYQKENLMVLLLNNAPYGSQRAVVWKDKTIADQSGHCSYNIFTE